MLSLEAFGMTISYHYGMPDTVLLQPVNKRQWDAFAELQKLGFCYLDTERGITGFRSTLRGKDASSIVQGVEKDGS